MCALIKYSKKILANLYTNHIIGGVSVALYHAEVTIASHKPVFLKLFFFFFFREGGGGITGSAQGLLLALCSGITLTSSEDPMVYWDQIRISQVKDKLSFPAVLSLQPH